MTGKRLRANFLEAQKEGNEFKWIIENKDSGITLDLDSDTTFIDFPHIELDDYRAVMLTNYLGASEGVYDLLNALGINIEDA